MIDGVDKLIDLEEQASIWFIAYSKRKEEEFYLLVDICSGLLRDLETPPSSQRIFYVYLYLYS